jgi:NitT/TauT family transport system substrate-binding protein
MFGVLAVVGIAAIAGAYLIVGPNSMGRRDPEMARPAPEISSITMRLMGSYGPEFAGEMLAEKSGPLAGEAARLALREGASSDEAIASVVDGVDAIGVARADRFLEARAKGAPIVAFAAGFIESPVAFYALKASGIEGAQDFAQKRIGRRAGDDTEVSFEALAAQLGLPRSTMHAASVGADVSMLVRGEVDVWPGHVGEDDYALTKLGADYLVVSPAAYGVHLPGTVYFASERTIRERPQLVRGFLNSVIAGWKRAYADTALSAPTIVAFDNARLTPDSVRFALERQRDYVRPLAARYCEFDERHWRSLQAILLSQRLLDQPVDLSLAVNYQFLEDAYRKPYTFGK